MCWFCSSITHKKIVPIVVKTKISIRKKIVSIVPIVVKTNARKKESASNAWFLKKTVGTKI